MHLINNVFKKINQSSCQVYLGLNKFHSRLCNFCIGAIFLYITLPCRLGEFFLWFWQLYVVFCRFASFLSIHNLPLPIHVWSFPHFQRPSHHTSSIVRTFPTIFINFSPPKFCYCSTWFHLYIILFKFEQWVVIWCEWCIVSRRGRIPTRRQNCAKENGRWMGKGVKRNSLRGYF